MQKIFSDLNYQLVMEHRIQELAIEDFGQEGILWSELINKDKEKQDYVLKGPRSWEIIDRFLHSDDWFIEDSIKHVDGKYLLEDGGEPIVEIEVLEEKKAVSVDPQVTDGDDGLLNRLLLFLRKKPTEIEKITEDTELFPDGGITDDYLWERLLDLTEEERRQLNIDEDTCRKMKAELLFRKNEIEELANSKTAKFAYMLTIKTLKNLGYKPSQGIEQYANLHPIPLITDGMIVNDSALEQLQTTTLRALGYRGKADIPSSKEVYTAIMGWKRYLPNQPMGSTWMGIFSAGATFLGSLELQNQMITIAGAFLSTVVVIIGAQNTNQKEDVIISGMQDGITKLIQNHGPVLEGVEEKFKTDHMGTLLVEFNNYLEAVAKRDRERAVSSSQGTPKSETPDAQLGEREHENNDVVKPKANIFIIQDEMKRTESIIANARETIGMTAYYSSLSDFVHARVEDKKYESRLGLMHQIQKDLKELSTRLSKTSDDQHIELKAKMFPRGPPRVFLFIDDLDRCPPDKVVEVLEATQLLVKSKLFVVVIAMDVRYITRALEQKYKGILVRKGDPSGLDYIEKIIQIPYRIPPVTGGAVPSLIESQMDLEWPDEYIEWGASNESNGVSEEGGVENAPPETQAADTRPEETGDPNVPEDDNGDGKREQSPPRKILFSIPEREMVDACCTVINLSPRSLKRLVNVFKLLKDIWQQSDEGPPEKEGKRATILLIALSARFPDIMREKLAGMELLIKQESRQFIVNYLKQPERNLASTGKAKKEWILYTEALTNETLLDKNMPISDISLQRFNLIRSFSFVGDIGDDQLDPAARKRHRRRRSDRMMDKMI
jgi:hypothetical protein